MPGFCGAGVAAGAAVVVGVGAAVAAGVAVGLAVPAGVGVGLPRPGVDLPGAVTDGSAPCVAVAVAVGVAVAFADATLAALAEAADAIAAADESTGATLAFGAAGATLAADADAVATGALEVAALDRPRTSNTATSAIAPSSTTPATVLNTATLAPLEPFGEPPVAPHPGAVCTGAATGCAVAAAGPVDTTADGADGIDARSIVVMRSTMGSTRGGQNGATPVAISATLAHRLSRSFTRHRSTRAASAGGASARSDTSGG